jgi:hypothetical protein
MIRSLASNSTYVVIRILREEVLKKMNFFSKNRELAAFMEASAFPEGSGKTRRRGKPQRPRCITGRVAAPSDSFRIRQFPRASVGVAHIDLIEHVINVCPLCISTSRPHESRHLTQSPNSRRHAAPHRGQAIGSVYPGDRNWTAIH